MNRCICSLLNKEFDYNFNSDIERDYQDIKSFIPSFKTPSIQTAFNYRHLLHFPLENFESLLRKVDQIKRLQIGLQEDLELYNIVGFSNR